MSTLVSGMLNRIQDYHQHRTKSYIETLNKNFCEQMDSSLYQQHDPAELYNHLMNQLDSDINNIEVGLPKLAIIKKPKK